MHASIIQLVVVVVLVVGLVIVVNSWEWRRQHIFTEGQLEVRNIKAFIWRTPYWASSGRMYNPVGDLLYFKDSDGKHSRRRSKSMLFHLLCPLFPLIWCVYAHALQSTRRARPQHAPWIAMCCHAAQHTPRERYVMDDWKCVMDGVYNNQQSSTQTDTQCWNGEQWMAVKWHDFLQFLFLLTLLSVGLPAGICVAPTLAALMDTGANTWVNITAPVVSFYILLLWRRHQLQREIIITVGRTDRQTGWQRYLR